MNSGIGAMGPYNHANATIGRAYGLLSQNLQGGSVPGETYMGSQGNSYAYSAAFAENEERSPWDAVPRPAWLQADRQHREPVLRRLVHAVRQRSATTPGRRSFRGQLAACDPFIGPIVALDPLAARKLVEYGFDTQARS